MLSNHCFSDGSGAMQGRHMPYKQMVLPFEGQD